MFVCDLNFFMFDKNKPIRCSCIMKIYGLTSEERNARLATAAERGSIDVVRKLIEVGVNMNASKYYNHTWDLIPEHGHIRGIIGLADILHAVAKDRRRSFNTALMLAVRNGHHQCAELLIDAGADVNKKNNLGFTALMSAGLLKSNSRCYEILIKAGADVNVVNRVGQTAVHFATFLNNHEGMEMLLDAGADVNASDTNDRTPLITAAFFVSLPCIDLLVKAGAGVNKVEYYGKTALMSVGLMSEHLPDYKCLYRLLQAGSPVIKCQHYSMYDMNASEQHIAMYGINCRDEKLLCALHAAGEVVEGTYVRKADYNKPVPDYVQELNRPEGNLKDMCRRAIRKHLMELSPVNLFCKIPQLGLPKLMENYLLYGVNLDINDDDEKNTWHVKTRSSKKSNYTNNNSSSSSSSYGSGNNINNDTKSINRSSNSVHSGSTSRNNRGKRKAAEVGPTGPHVSKYGRRSRKPDRLNISQ